MEGDVVAGGKERTRRCRRCARRRDEWDGVLWFFIRKGGEPALDISRDSDVNVSYADPVSKAYVSVSGSARFVDDMAKKKALWNPLAQA